MRHGYLIISCLCQKFYLSYTFSPNHMNRYFLLYCIAALLPVMLHAQQLQEPCGTMPYLHHQKQQDPQLEQRMEAIETFTQKWIAKNPDVKQMESIITIPVVVHVLYNAGAPATNVSDAKILTQLAVLNEDFRRLNWNADDTPTAFLPVAADAELEFCLATRGPDGFPTSGITRTATAKNNFSTSANDAKFDTQGGKNAWPATEYLNVWVVPAINGGNVAGYAQFPGGNLATDGVVIGYNFFGTIPPLNSPYVHGRTTVHEVGHWLNLRHIWGDGPCDQDDFVNDTPRSDAANYGCPNTNSCTNETPDYNDMVQNYMDYSNDNCQNLFTLGQKQRMRALFEPGGFRFSLLQSNGCTLVELGASDARLVSIIEPFGAGNCTVLEPVISFQNFGTTPLYYVEVVYSIDGSGVYNYQWTGELAPTATTTITLPPVVIDNGSLLHTLNVTLENPNGVPDFNPTNNTITTSFTTALPGTALPFADSFENSSPFPFGNWSFNSADGVFFSLNTNTGFSGTHSAFMNNYTYNAAGEIDDFNLPRLDFLGYSPTLEFQVAYAQQAETDIPDVLEVLVSGDCGHTFTTMFIKGGAELATAPVVSGAPFVPNLNQWRKESIDLSVFSDLRNVIIKFRQTRGAGNNLYIDDVNLLSYIVGIENVQAPVSSGSFFTLYPNPATHVVSLSFSNSVNPNEPATLTITDKTGKLISSQTDLAASPNFTPMATSELPAGIYFVTFTQANTTQTQKLIVVK